MKENQPGDYKEPTVAFFASTPRWDRLISSVYAGAQRPNSAKWALGAGGSHGFGGSNALGSGVCETDALTEDGES